jgi:TRAP-type transport system small permease protein
MPALRVVTRVLTWICAFGAGISMAAVFAIVFFNSLRRYTIGKSLEWGEELPIYLTIYGVIFGAGMAYLQDRHIRFTVLTDFLPDRYRQKLMAVVDLSMVVVGGLLAYSGWLFMMRRGGVEASGLIGTSKDLATDLGIEWIEAFGHLGVWQFSMVLGGIVLGLAALVKFVERVSMTPDRQA